jgi:predicted dehydrogenase
LTSSEKIEAAASRFQYAGVSWTSLTSWLSAVRNQQITIFGERGTLIFDDKAERKLAIHDKKGAVCHPSYGDELPLTRELHEFLKLVRHGRTDSSHITLGLSVVHAIAAAEQSIAAGGVETKIGI